MHKKIDIVTKAMTAGGAERVISQLVNYFAQEEIDCRLITTDDREIDYDLNPKTRLTVIGKKSNNKLLDRFIRYKKIRKIVLEDMPDVVLTMPEDTGIYVILALLGTGIGVYVSERNNPWIMPDVRVTRLLRRITYPFAKGIIFQTEMAKSYFPKHIQKKGIVLKNPVDASRIPLPYREERKKKFVAIGRLEAQKNFSMLISAFADFNKKNKGFQLIIYGEGRERRKLEKLIAELGLKQLVFLPGRDKNVLNNINNATAFILSSDYEGMPNALIEAMCMGVPVISTDCPSGGPRDLIENKKNGILIPVGDSKELVSAMNIVTIPSVAKKMTKNSEKMRSLLTDVRIFEEWREYLFRQK